MKSMVILLSNSIEIIKDMEERSWRIQPDIIEKDLTKLEKAIYNVKNVEFKTLQEFSKQNPRGI